MVSEVVALMGEMRTGLEELYGPRLRGFYLFGSRARGDAEPDSDVDVLIILDDFERYGIELKRVIHLASDLSLEYDLSVNVVLVRERDWAESDTPFLRNVRREAVAA